MTIKTKYNYGDTVFWADGNLSNFKIYSGKIFKIVIFANEIIDISYYITPDNNFLAELVPESVLSKTKRGLLDKLEKQRKSYFKN